MSEKNGSGKCAVQNNNNGKIVPSRKQSEVKGKMVQHESEASF